MYAATLKDIIPLPDPDAPPASPSHINAYPEFSAGSTVLALYPDTSCLYQAKVIQGPRDAQNARVRMNYIFIAGGDNHYSDYHHVKAGGCV